MAIYNKLPVRVRESEWGRTVISAMVRDDSQDDIPRKGNRHRRGRHVPTIAGQLERIPGGWRLRRGNE